ncbi:hypothetical protein TRIP_B250160 [uncultured Desulfatiglans sp.]|nr:hypothetical protein TRIP_B250160 [uncultured Desulfatiglans sp.]
MVKSFPDGLEVFTIRCATAAWRAICRPLQRMGFAPITAEKPFPDAPLENSYNVNLPVAIPNRLFYR